MIRNIFAKLTKDPQQQENLMLFFTFGIIAIFIVLGIAQFVTAITQHLWQSYLWGALLLIFAMMQSFGLKSMIRARKPMQDFRKQMQEHGMSIEEEITPEQIDKILDGEKKK